MKQKVIEFFQNLPEESHEQFNKAFELYRASENKSVSAERVFNASGYSPRNLENLLYDLQKMHGVTDLERMAVNKVHSEKIEELEETLADIEFEKDELKAENERLKKLKKADAVSIRAEFPFLNDKDCPDEFKILIADKITAWNNYQDAHALLLKVESGEKVLEPEALADVAKIATDSFARNQAIYEELNHYKENGVVLGKDPLFKTLALKREVEAMTTDELVKYKSSSAKYFSTNKKDLAKAVAEKNEEKAVEINARVADRREKLELVEKRLKSL